MTDSSAECGLCNAIFEDECSITCAECSLSYHFGQHCSGIAESTYTSMGSAKREKWRCRTCRGDSRATVASGKLSQDSSSGILARLSSLEDKLTAILGLKDVIDSLALIPIHVDKLTLTCQSLQTTTVELKASVTFMSSQYDKLLEQCNSNSQATMRLDQKVVCLEETVSEQAKQISHLQSQLNDSEQYTRRANLEISGLPVTANEDLPAVLSDLAVKLNLHDHTAEQVCAVHRLSGGQGKIPVVLARFTSPDLRDKWLQARARLRALAENKQIPDIFFSENLTRANSELFWRARVQGKAKGFKFVWVRNGKIFARKTEGATALKISSVSDIDKMA